jgi:cellulose synthase/poly-beta-1,6-N-acetylglucosamine synthase-like glycosyltransferase
MTTFLYILELLVYSFFAATVAYTLFFSIAGHFKGSQPKTDANIFHRVAILIPAYKEDSVITGAAKSMLLLDYPKLRYEVYVIADQLKSSTIETLKRLDIHVVEVSFEKSTKTKSLNHCLSLMDRSAFDMILISDADNVLERSFLKNVNNAFAQGHRAIQGRRVAKNAETNMAVLDGASEAINNHIFRQGPSNLGLSASLIGSAMAFSTKDVTDALASIQAVGGFDKVLQLGIIEKGNTIHYLPNAIAYDEKVSTHTNFQNQRKRWLYSQYRYLGNFFGKAMLMLIKGNVDYFNIAVLHNLFLPRVLNLGLLPILIGISFLLHDYLVITPLSWAILFGGYTLALALALPKKYYSWKVMVALAALPKGFLGMFTLLFKLKGADKQFIHTTHAQAEVEDSLLAKDENKK